MSQTGRGCSPTNLQFQQDIPTRLVGDRGCAPLLGIDPGEALRRQAYENCRSPQFWRETVESADPHLRILPWKIGIVKQSRVEMRRAPVGLEVHPPILRS